ncbi:MAG: RNA polymerase sigma factor [Patescibacteria group bacterium]
MRELIQAILEGDEQAVTKFYYQFSPRIARFLSRKLPPQDVQGLVNEVFMEAIDALPTLKEDANLSSWLYSIAQHKIVDFYRKRKVKSLVLSQLPFLDILAREIDQPEFQMEKDKIRDRMEEAYHVLSEKYRHILMLHYEQDLPIKEIALQLDLSPKATESLLFRARQSFKKAYERE